MSFVPNEHEIEVLMMLNGDRPSEWGAWVGACLEFLSGAGFCTRGPHYKITDKGRSFLLNPHNQTIDKEKHDHGGNNNNG